MKQLFKYLFLFLFMQSCKKESEQINVIGTEKIMPLQVAKVFFYRFDSIVPINFGQRLDTHCYVAKDTIESSFTDQMGNPSFRIFRYLRDTAQTQAWKFNCTNVVSIVNGNIEYIENNLRYVKLVTPVNSNYSWKGNQYINTQSPSPHYYLSNWNYRYDNIEMPFKTKLKIFDTTYTVLEHDEANPSVYDPSTYNQKIYSKAVYAKNVGLIYRDFLFYIWQVTPSPRFQDDAFGIRMNLIDYK